MFHITQLDPATNQPVFYVTKGKASEVVEWLENTQKHSLRSIVVQWEGFIMNPAEFLKQFKSAE